MDRIIAGIQAEVVQSISTAQLGNVMHENAKFKVNSEKDWQYYRHMQLLIQPQSTELISYEFLQTEEVKSPHSKCWIAFWMLHLCQIVNDFEMSNICANLASAII